MKLSELTRKAHRNRPGDDEVEIGSGRFREISDRLQLSRFARNIRSWVITLSTRYW